LLTDNLNLVKKRIEEACAKSGRNPKEVTLVAVSKKKPEEDILELYRAGQRDFGENYIQELRTKQEDLPKDIRWHMIGHLQRNKVKYIAGTIAMIHSVDSLELAETIDREALKNGRIIPILMEVNVAGEESKFGVRPEEADALAEQISHLQNVRLQGFMTSAPFAENPEEDRPVFRNLRKLSVDIGQKNYNNVTVDALSMGMTNDYSVAVEEGSTIVRVGTAIFGARDYQ